MDAPLRPDGAPQRRLMRGGMPPERPCAMPTQSLQQAPSAHPLGPAPLRVVAARFVLILCTLGFAGYGCYEMLGIVNFSQMTMLQGVMIGFFVITLTWISFAAGSAIAGLLTPPRRQPAGDAAIRSRTALVMPVYNEDPTRVAASLQAMAEDLAHLDAAHHFEIVVISDSTHANAWINESLTIDRLRRALRQTMPVWYRRRWRNTARKAGNVEDFVRRWGGRYDFMVVLDADSLMAGETLVELVRRMQADPRLGILQTVPALHGGASLFARLQQFASRVYGGVIARGVAAWSGNEGNYWGHNAIIRVSAFAAACALPLLPGRKPFGGHVLSHDFVEAALMRRAGWKVQMAADLGGSWEEAPPSLVDVATRDRRWAQGNLQHSKVIGARGLATASRGHFLIGMMSYLSSPLWLALLAVGFALTLQANLIRPEYFSENFQLFPDWPQFDAARMTRLFIYTMAILLLPKLLGILYSLCIRTTRRSSGGVIGITGSALVETLVSALYAPIMMLVQTQHVLEIVTGRDSGWQAQRRHADATAWDEAWRHHRWHVVCGLIIAAIAFSLSPTLLAWLAPTLAGLLLAVPLAKLSGSVQAGRTLRSLGLLRIAEERDAPAIIRRRDELISAAPETLVDGLRYLASDPSSRCAHIAGNLPPPAPTRGQPDASRLTAQHKLQDARSRSEALEWLEPAERIHVASEAELLEQLARLPDR